MTDEIRIKVKKKAVKKKVSKKAVKKVIKKVVKKVVKKATSADSLPEEIEIDLLLGMDSEELDDESKRALIRARTAQAEKQSRLNQIAEGQLVERKEVIETIKTICFGAVEILDLFPDQVGPLVHKKTQKQIREKLVQNVDKVKQKFIGLLMEFDND